MSTALTVTGVGIASTTLATAGTMSNSTVTPPGFTNASDVVGVATGWGEIWYNINAGAWAAGGAIGAPTGHGFLYDVTSLEGQQILAGNWTPTLRFGGLSAGTLTGTLVTRAYKRSSGGTYTLIMSSTLAAQTFAPAFANYAFPATAGSSTAFATGDKLYVDIWLNITANTTGSGTATLALGDVSNTAGEGTIHCAWVTPGYALDTLDVLSRFGLKQAGGDPPLTIYGLHAASTTLTTAASTGTATGGVSSSFTSLVGTATGYGELYGLGNAGAWAAGGSLPAPDGHGWILDSTLLEGQLLQAGTFTMTHRLATSAAYTTFTATLYGRVYKYNGGTYTQIGPTMSVAANLTTTTTVYTLSATMPNTYFGTGDKLYFDTFLQITASTGGVGTTTVRVSNSSDATFGVANQAQLVTAGYLPGNAKDAPARFRLVKALDAVSRLRLQSALQIKDVAARFGLQSGTSATRSIPRVFGGTILIASSITSASRDALSRFRLLANKSVSVASRLRLQSAPAFKDGLARFRLVKARDALSRLRLLAATSKSFSSRFRLNTPSALTMAWIYPGSPACNAPFEYADGRRIDVLKPQYYALQSDGTLVQNTVALSGCNGYSTANATDIKAYSTQQFVTISGLTPGMDALATDSTKTTNFINTLTAFLTANGFTGIELDFEGFGLSSMSATQYADYKTLVTTVGNALHASGFKLMIDGPAIFNSTYQGLFRWHWEDFDTLPVDYLVVLCYDFQFDNGSGTAVAPLATITSTCTWMQSRITDPNRIVIGLNSYGYHGTTGAFSGITIDTQVQSQSLPGFGTATRDAGSGEMMWATGGVSYDYSDTTTLDGKRAAVYATGLRNISVWHLGGNQWFSNVMANTASRFRQQSSVLPHDLQARYRLLANKSLDALTRFRVLSTAARDAQARLRLQSAQQFKDALSRLRLQSGTTFHGALSRFRLVITPLRDALTRLRLQSSVQNRDARNRFRLGVPRALDTLTRLRVQSSVTIHDVVSRFRQLATKSADALSRFRLQSVAQFKDTVTRFRLQSGSIYHDTLSRFRQLAMMSKDAAERFRLQSGTTYRDALSRLRLQSVVQTKDALTRLRLLATKSVDAVYRFRLQSVQTSRDAATRFRLSVAQSKDALSRLRLLATQTKDALTRLRLQSGTQRKDALSRLRLQSGTTLHDALTRFRLVITPLRDTLTRLRLQSGTTYHDALSRFRLQQVGTHALDALSRVRLQSGTTYHDLLSRFRLVITPLRDALSRFRVQSGIVSKDASARFLQQSALVYKDVQARFRQLATTSLDALSRFRLLATRSVDALSRFRLASAALSKDAIGRLRLQSGTTLHDVMNRFRLSEGLDVSIRFRLVKTLDAIARFRLLATKSVDVLTRFRQQSSITLRDAIGRLRLQSGTTYHDALSRFRQQSGVKTSDTSSRLRLLTTTSRDALARYRLLATKSVDAIGRFRLGIPRTLDALSRLRLQSGTIAHDLQARFRLQQVGVRSLDILSRFRQQSGTTYRDALVRLRLVITPLRDIASRFRMQSILQNKDSQGRFRQIAVRSLDIVSRLRVQSAQQLKDSLARLRLLATRNADQPARFRQQSTVQRKDAQSRYRQLATRSLDALARFRQQSSATLKDARNRFLLLAVMSVSVVVRLRVQSALVARDTLSRFRLQIGNPRAVGALARLRLKSGTGGRDAQARFSLTTQALSSAGTIPITMTFRDGVGELTFRDGVAEETFR